MLLSLTKNLVIKSLKDSVDELIKLMIGFDKKKVDGMIILLPKKAITSIFIIDARALKIPSGPRQAMSLL